jgi:hypothetical protein
MSPGSILAAFLLTAIAQAGQIDFELQNGTRFAFEKVWITKHEAKIWNSDILNSHALRSGWTKEVTLKNDSGWLLWDLKIQYWDASGKRRLELFTDQGFELPRIKRIVITVLSSGKWDAHYE